MEEIAQTALRRFARLPFYIAVVVTISLAVQLVVLFLVGF